MIDPLPEAVNAVMHGDAARLPLVAAAGLVTSFGPCVAPRYVALATLMGGKQRIRTVAAFVTGLITVYASLGLGAGILSTLVHNAAALNAVLATVLVLGGLITIVRVPVCKHEHVDAGPHHRLSATFILGAASALVVSPCCTPMVAAVAAFPALDVSPLTRATMLAVFALGHAAPMLLAGIAGAACARRLQRLTASPAPAVISGTLMVALGGYYGLLV